MQQKIKVLSADPVSDESANRNPQDGGSHVRYSPETLLRAGRIIALPVTGWSMYPMLVPGRDLAVLVPLAERLDAETGEEDFPSLSDLRRGDVVLFRRGSGKLVLHRIFRILPEEYWFVGDNLPDIERGIRADQLIGRMTGLVRDGRKVRTDSLCYRFLTAVWLNMRPLRPLIHTVTRLVRSTSHRNSGRGRF